MNIWLSLMSNLSDIRLKNKIPEFFFNLCDILIADLIYC